MGGFIRNETYYAGIVYEWNLPTGSSCPFAKECKVTVDRETGKFDIHDGEYRCYAAAAERFPAVRQHRWENFEFIRAGGTPQLPADCKAVRIHSSGDFFNQEYFDLWCWIAKQNPTVEFWAFTKSIQYVVNRLGVIPDNLTITASFGGDLSDVAGSIGYETVIKTMKKFQKAGGIVLDPCCGKGYSAKAALELGMKFRGNELNSKRLAETIARLKGEHGT